MTVECESARRWLASSSVGQTDQRPEDCAPHAAHIAKCPPCKALLRRYGAFIADCQVAYSYEPDVEAEARFLSSVEKLATYAAEYAPLVHALRQKLDHRPSESAEVTFLENARRQRDSTRTPVAREPTRFWKPALVVAAAAVLVVAVWQSWSGAPEPDASRTPLSAEHRQEAITVASYSGRVLVDDEPLTVEKSSLARTGTTIQTGPASHVELRDSSAAWLSVGAESSVAIVAWRSRSARFLLRSGTVHAKVMHRESDELFEIRTPNARITVVGTEFSVAHNATDGTTVNAASGTVRVEREDGSLAGFVSAGATLRVATEVAVTKPIVPPEKPAVIVAPTGPKARQSTRRSKPRAVAHHKKERKREEAPPPTLDEAASPRSDTATARTTPLRRARTLLAEGEVDRAIALLLKIPASDWRRDALLGDAYQLAGQYRAAQKAYRDSVTKTTQPPASILADLATLQETRLNNAREAAKTWRRYLDAHPDGGDAARAHLGVARAALNAGHDKASERHFQTILDQFPRASESTAALALLGGHLLKGERWSEAEALFVRPYAKTVDAETSLVGLIRVRIAQGDQDAAASLLSRYWQRFPKGLRHHEVKRLERAISNP